MSGTRDVENGGGALVPRGSAASTALADWGGSGAEVVPDHTIGQASVATAMREVEGRIMVAQRIPRDERRALERILIACGRSGLAEVAHYEFPRGGGSVSGPSIRLAEEIARNWGHIESGWRELDRQPGRSLVEAFAWDLQTNVREVRTFWVPHRIDTKTGGRQVRDERELYELLANQAARRKRACILAMIPGDVTEAASATCEETLRAKIGNVQETAAKIVESFKGFGVSAAMIEKRLGRSLASIEAGHILQLRKVYASLRDGMASVEQFFEPESTKADSLSDAVAAKAANAGISAPPADKPARKPRQTRPPADPAPADGPVVAASGSSADPGPPTPAELAQLATSKGVKLPELLFVLFRNGFIDENVSRVQELPQAARAKAAELLSGDDAATRLEAIVAEYEAADAAEGGDAQ